MMYVGSVAATLLLLIGIKYIIGENTTDGLYRAVISHEIPLVFKVADSAVILSGGKKIYEGGKEALARRDDIFDSINISLPPVVRLSRRYGFGKVCYNVEEFAEQAAAMLKREDA